MTGLESARVGVVFWKKETDLLSLISGTARDLGCEVTNFPADSRVPQGLDVVLACGPFGSLAPLGSQLSRMPPGERPALALWMTEQFSNPALPAWAQYLAGVTRSHLERLAYRETETGVWQLNPCFQPLIRRAHRLRYFGDLKWLRAAGVLTVLAVGSRWIARYLNARGVDAGVAFIGAHPSWGADLKLERDVPVLWLGKVASSRRRRVLQAVRADLRRCGLDMLMVDGEEHPYVFGDERTRLLNRARVVLNILREPWDNHSLRYFLAAPNRAMIVTEPTYPHTPFEPGVHLVAAPVDQLANTIAHYAQHDAERSQIAERAYALVTSELTMRRSVHEILTQTLARRQLS